MRIAIISDAHFGDPVCSLVDKDSKGKFIIGDKYPVFKDAVGKDNDYLNFSWRHFRLLDC